MFSRGHRTGSLDAHYENDVITHGNLDYRGELPEVQRRFDVVRLWGDGDSATPATQQLDIGDRIRLSAQTTIEVLSPPVVTAGRLHRTDNDRSLVLLITIGDRRIQLIADIEAPAEQWLLASGTARARTC